MLYKILCMKKNASLWNKIWKLDIIVYLHIYVWNNVACNWWHNSSVSVLCWSTVFSTLWWWQKWQISEFLSNSDVLVPFETNFLWDHNILWLFSVVITSLLSSSVSLQLPVPMPICPPIICFPAKCWAIGVYGVIPSLTPVAAASHVVYLISTSISS